MNIKLLRRIQKQILKEPRQFQMNIWFTEEISGGKVAIPNCGTAACIGGWAITLDAKVKPNIARRCCRLTSVARTLCITPREENLLCYFSEWPEQFRKIPDSEEGTPAFARQAVRRIDHFIKTKGWE